MLPDCGFNMLCFDSRKIFQLKFCLKFAFSLQAQYLEEILREGYSHPAVKGIIMFAGPEIAGFNATTLADKNFTNTPSGDVVDNLIAEWKSGASDHKTDGGGLVSLSLFHGDYDVIVRHPLTNYSTTLSFRVAEEKPQKIVHVHI